MDFPALLQSARLERRLTVAEAASVFGISARTYEGWEQGRVTKTWMHLPLLEYFERHAPMHEARTPAPPRPRPARKGQTQARMSPSRNSRPRHRVRSALAG